jgi:hypothetical protein
MLGFPPLLSFCIVHVVSVVLAIGTPGVATALALSRVSAPAAVQHRKCCCGTADGRCCGMACCGTKAPSNKPQAPAVDLRLGSSDSFGIPQSAAEFCIASSPPAVSDLARTVSHALRLPTLLQQGVRINV